ncbi:MAG: hypothetical protein R3F34_07560 [Planctomycetota bacterium]
MIEMRCPWCIANRDDLRRKGPGGMDALLTKLVDQRRALDGGDVPAAQE